MSKTVIFIHGAWVTPACWDNFSNFFKQRGYECLAPAWKYKDKSVEELRQNPDPALATLGITEIVDHYQQIIEKLNEPPILIGHSFGGLFVQMLLDRGLGKAGVAINSAPPKWVLPLFYWSAIKSNMGVLTTPFGWRRVVRLSFPEFQYAFVNGMPLEEQKAAYDAHVVPETGRIFFQAALALTNNASSVNFKNDKRAPLLMIAGIDDRICPEPQIKDNFERYKKSSARTDYMPFHGRNHWIIAQKGWDEVAVYIAEWLRQVTS